MPKSNTSKEASTEIVDVAGIDTRMFTLPREVLIERKLLSGSQQRP